MGVIDLAAFTFNFLANYTLGAAGTYIYLPTADDYLDTLTGIIAGYAIALESPVIVYVLSEIGMLSIALLQKFRKYAFLIILVLAAVITVSPDWISQETVTIPVFIAL